MQSLQMQTGNCTTYVDRFSALASQLRCLNPVHVMYMLLNRITADYKQHVLLQGATSFAEVQKSCRSSVSVDTDQEHDLTSNVAVFPTDPVFHIAAVHHCLQDPTNYAQQPNRGATPRASLHRVHALTVAKPDTLRRSAERRGTRSRDQVTSQRRGWGLAPTAHHNTQAGSLSMGLHLNANVRCLLLPLPCLVV